MLVSTAKIALAHNAPLAPQSAQNWFSGSFSSSPTMRLLRSPSSCAGLVGRGGWGRRRTAATATAFASACVTYLAGHLAAAEERREAAKAKTPTQTAPQRGDSGQVLLYLAGTLLASVRAAAGWLRQRGVDEKRGVRAE